MDYTLEYLKKSGIPVTRENYVGLNWLGDYDPAKPLPAELEASLPAEIQMKGDENTQEEEKDNA
jgi:hypothetical protein